MSLKICKNCESTIDDIREEDLQCAQCSSFVHTKCLMRGSVPGGITGDVFFKFICQECSDNKVEQFVRDKLQWMQVIVLVLYHMQTKCQGVARKGYFHWKTHITAFIDKHWDILFRSDFKRKKKWTGTISGILSHHSPHFFKSGTGIFGEQGWWTLTYPKLAPKIIVQLYAEMMIEKPKSKESKLLTDEQLLKLALEGKPYATDEFLNSNSIMDFSENGYSYEQPMKRYKVEKKKTKHLPTFSNIISDLQLNVNPTYIQPKESEPIKVQDEIEQQTENVEHKPVVYKFMDPMCHYNTSLRNTNVTDESILLKTKLLGGIREMPILSSYSLLHLGPYIRRDVTTKSAWLQLMDDVRAKVNLRNQNYTLPERGPIDYVYVQPEHIPAINSLCNQFFWPGIDLVDTLKFPDFSCVVQYRRLIIGFAFLVPSVKVNESYLSFIFVRPGWRNCGIAKFMIYHLAQCSIGKDITLHVSISNPALLLYQKCGFKVEHVVQNFYDKYLPDDSRDSKNAFFCRLER